ncbi:hypothetical protein AAFF_G00037850 [Aldrovandia affinis]|uniref:Uncharacterized protein n=1 Tax=Aldrovandia affinis TaxID=143900 RepID=A0AAD7WZE9_9TELE|nr:hypothetical protein AAFF_G00037850 [Aldrovandia affinis]
MSPTGASVGVRLNPPWLGDLCSSARTSLKTWHGSSGRPVSRCQSAPLLSVTGTAAICHAQPACHGGPAYRRDDRKTPEGHSLPPGSGGEIASIARWTSAEWNCRA